MANVSFWQGSWVDSGDIGLLPGATHNWILTGVTFNDVVSVTAVPLNSGAGDQVLAVSGVQSEADPSGGRRFFFSVTNAGPARAIGYSMNFSFVSP
jgi:hypothetical protein